MPCGAISEMKFAYSLEFLAIFAVVAFCLLFFASSLSGTQEFPGSDTAGSRQTSAISGTPVEQFHPLIPQWKPPGSEIESGLFALQAAIGGICVGGAFGYW